MGLFNDVEEREQSAIPTQQDIQKALMMIGFAMAAVDGEIADSETDRMLNAAARMPLFNVNSSEEDEAVLAQARTEVTTDAKQALTWAFTVLRQENWRAVAFCLVSEVALADGRLDEKELKFLNQTGTELGLSPQEAQAIFTTFKTYYRPFQRTA